MAHAAEEPKPLPPLHLPERLITANYTRYNTDDLEALYRQVIEAVYEVARQNPGNVQHSRPSLDLQVESWGGKVPHRRKNKSVLSGASEFHFERFVRGGKTSNLHLRAPDWVLSHVSELERLAEVSEDHCGLVPQDCVREVVHWFTVTAVTAPQGFGVWGPTREAARKAGLGAKGPIRIEWNVQTKRVRSTKEGRISRYRSEYGPGGHLQGSSKNWAGIWQRAPNNILSEARRVYTNEYDRRMAWAAKIVAEGGTVEPYETWAQYLERWIEEVRREHLKGGKS